MASLVAVLADLPDPLADHAVQRNWDAPAAPLQD